jgi:hypothetical protein
MFDAKLSNIICDGSRFIVNFFKPISAHQEIEVTLKKLDKALKYMQLIKYIQF